jgi:hypothetical protein
MNRFLATALLVSSVMFSQTAAVRGVTLFYDNIHNTLTLTIPQKLMAVSDKDSEVRVTIDKKYSLRMTVNGASVATGNHYFSLQGHSYGSMSIFSTLKPSNCVEVRRNYVFKFTDIQPDEYILRVSDVCDNKWESNGQSISIIIQ